MFFGMALVRLGQGVCTICLLSKFIYCFGNVSARFRQCIGKVLTRFRQGLGTGLARFGQYIGKVCVMVLAARRFRHGLGKVSGMV